MLCDQNKLTENNCAGSPDLIIEVVSPSSTSRDYVKKLWLYEKYGVKEYLIVNPKNCMITIYRINENGEFKEPQQYKENSKVKISIFDDLDIHFSDIM